MWFFTGRLEKLVNLLGLATLLSSAAFAGKLGKSLTLLFPSDYPFIYLEGI